MKASSTTVNKTTSGAESASMLTNGPQLIGQHIPSSKDLSERRERGPSRRKYSQKIPLEELSFPVNPD
jgi:hypothetical protein